MCHPYLTLFKGVTPLLQGLHGPCSIAMHYPHPIQAMPLRQWPCIRVAQALKGHVSSPRERLAHFIQCMSWSPCTPCHGSSRVSSLPQGRDKARPWPGLSTLLLSIQPPSGNQQAFGSCFSKSQPSHLQLGILTQPSHGIAPMDMHPSCTSFEGPSCLHQGRGEPMHVVEPMHTMSRVISHVKPAPRPWQGTPSAQP